MSLNWEETKSIALEAELLFSRGDDIRDIKDIAKMANEIELHCSNTVKDAKELIKQITNRLTAKEGEATTSLELTHLRKIEAIDDEYRRSLLDINKFRHQIESTNEEIIRLEAATTEVQAKMNDEQPASQMLDSRTTYALSLYAKISNISWDYTSKTGILEGYVGNESSKSMDKFSIDTHKLTSFEVANTLWDFIGRDYDSLSTE